MRTYVWYVPSTFNHISADEVTAKLRVAISLGIETRVASFGAQKSAQSRLGLSKLRCSGVNLNVSKLMATLSLAVTSSAEI